MRIQVASAQTGKQRQSVSVRRVIGPIARYGCATILALIFLLPFYLMLRNGLATDKDITSPDWTFFPQQLHFENIQELFSDHDVPFLDGLINSTVIALLQTFGQILISALAGYGLARVPYRWSKVVLFAVLLTLMI